MFGYGTLFAANQARLSSLGSSAWNANSCCGRSAAFSFLHFEPVYSRAFPGTPVHWLFCLIRYRILDSQSATKHHANLHTYSTADVCPHCFDRSVFGVCLEP